MGLRRRSYHIFSRQPAHKWRWGCQPYAPAALFLFFFIRIVGGGVQLGPLGMAATDWPIVPAPGDYDNGEFGGMKIGSRKSKYWEEIYPSSTLSTTNPTWPDPGSNPGRRGGKPATNRLSYGAARLPLFISQEDSWYSFLSEAESTTGTKCGWKD
jgi:hypothetical protein